MAQRVMENIIFMPIYYVKSITFSIYFDNTLHITRRDRKAISYIKNAHDKVNGSKESDINILVVCTSGIIDQAEWVNYYIKNKDKIQQSWKLIITQQLAKS